MNRDEKSALFRFVTLYTLSSIILIAIIAYLYYEKEMDRQKRVCKNRLQNSIIKIESQLLRAKLNHKEFIFNPKGYTVGIGLFDNNHHLRYSSPSNHRVNFDAMMTKTPHYIQLIHRLEEPLFNIHYIVTEDTGMPMGKKKLLTLIMIVILLSFIFIAFIGYLLSQILLRPIKEKMHQLDKFIKDSAHEINTPIAALLMSVSALKKKGSADEKILQHITISSKQIADVYNSLSHLAFDEINIPRTIEEIDFKVVTEKSVAFYKELAKSKKMQIYTKLESTPIMIDKDDAQKLINNLLSNAVKYNRYGKDITITLKQHILTVKDNGIGIEEEERQSILKRYHRGTNLQGGFGIGLDIVNAIIKHYGILLNIHSKKGVGSQFRLDFSSIAHKT